MEEKKIIAFKGFDKNLCCKGFQYIVGEEYEHTGDVKCCKSGFHACDNPFDVLEYYDFDVENRFCKVEQSGTIVSRGRKQTSSKIKIISEIGITGLFNAGIEWIKERTNPELIIKETKLNGDCSISHENKLGLSGIYAKIGSSGDYAKIGSSGNDAQIGSSGDYAKIGSSGDYAQIGSSGDYAKIDSAGCYSVICCAGDNSIVKAKIGSWITLAEWVYSPEKGYEIPVCVKTEFVDGERIKEDTWYKLIDGEFVEQ